MQKKQFHSKYHNEKTAKFLVIYMGIIKYKDNPSGMAEYIEKNRDLFRVSDEEIKELKNIK